MEILKEAIAKCGEDASESDWFGMQTLKPGFCRMPASLGTEWKKPKGRKKRCSLSTSLSPQLTLPFLKQARGSRDRMAGGSLSFPLTN